MSTKYRNENFVIGKRTGLSDYYKDYESDMIWLAITTCLPICNGVVIMNFKNLLKSLLKKIKI